MFPSSLGKLGRRPVHLTDGAEELISGLTKNLQDDKIDKAEVAKRDIDSPMTFGALFCHSVGG
ncbi:hypothetical protein HYALB_00002160 [Hymenoscyphus albidus]|uniref:Uncharacterized protein n=1 Tax=Hymenoscyphus albidus TaxID=595503 RepID=A0A9N9LQM5_9HELO|nr:hypothetical protein HYALB_00002160 [Hymenoscyphus albidus]